MAAHSWQWGTIGDVADVSRIFANTNAAAAGGAIAL